jgi:hypothetical protein
VVRGIETSTLWPLESSFLYSQSRLDQGNKIAKRTALVLYSAPMKEFPPRVIKREQRTEIPAESPVVIDRDIQKLIQDAHSLVGTLEKKFEIITAKLKAAQAANLTTS